MKKKGAQVKTTEKATEGLASETEAVTPEDSAESMDSLRERLALSQSRAEELLKSSREACERVTQLETELRLAVESYRRLMVEQNPEVIPELISGQTVEEINRSLELSRKLVARVKQSLEKEAVLARVPLGQASRQKPDFSSLSAREKIKYAVGGTN
ncbi:hypothetical protein B1774_01255 [Dehalococcoides mccartyi]|uniref:hypothetical protein n=1 Tax=Dehalococcoides mccartyi TaxID=61435 RepID=UPI00098FABF7|nr:hypothetical protein [Dehalococcoides mccartyi]AQU02751.1 hypothetical protein B1773_01445 [Dehalococcoides mccartyi]AQU04078.1 hypothetical protein B1774_01255 [Dehalococcoides mccartyi]MBF4482519.1 hypothetical protein [Dehalococcoides mccartyi]MBJ7532482.1 hypothetical protein [Dehalococcoides mccartyi]